MYDSIKDAACQLRRSIERAEIFVNANVVEPVWPDKVRSKSEPEFRHSGNPPFEIRRQVIMQDIEISLSRFKTAANQNGHKSDQIERLSKLLKKSVEDLLNWEMPLHVKLSRAEFQATTTAGKWARNRADSLLGALAPDLKVLRDMSGLSETKFIPCRRLLSCMEEIQAVVWQTFLEPIVVAEQEVLYAPSKQPRAKRGKLGATRTADTLRFPINSRLPQEALRTKPDAAAKVIWQSPLHPVVEFPGLHAYFQQRTELMTEFAERLAEFQRAAKLAEIRGERIIEISNTGQEAVRQLLLWDQTFRARYEAKFRLGLATVGENAAEKYVGELMAPVNLARQRIYDLQNIIDEPTKQKSVDPSGPASAPLGLPPIAGYLDLIVNKDRCEVSRRGEKYAHIQPIKLAGDVEWPLFQALYGRAGEELTKPERASLPGESGPAKRVAKRRLKDKFVALDVTIPPNEWRLIDATERNKDVAPAQ